MGEGGLLGITNSKRVKNIVIFAIILIACTSSCGSIPKLIVLHDPLTADEHITLGLSYEQKGEYDFAVQEYKKAIKITDADFRPFFYAGNVYYKIKDYKLSEKYYNKALKIAPANGDIHNNLAWVYIDTGKYEDAGKEADKALRLKKSPYYLDTLAHIYYHMGKYKEAMDALTEAIAMTPEDDKELRENENKMKGMLDEIINSRDKSFKSDP